MRGSHPELAVRVLGTLSTTRHIFFTIIVPLVGGQFDVISNHLLVTRAFTYWHHDIRETAHVSTANGHALVRDRCVLRVSPGAGTAVTAHPELSLYVIESSQSHICADAVEHAFLVIGSVEVGHFFVSHHGTVSGLRSHVRPELLDNHGPPVVHEITVASMNVVVPCLADGIRESLEGSDISVVRLETSSLQAVASFHLLAESHGAVAFREPRARAQGTPGSRQTGGYVIVADSEAHCGRLCEHVEGIFHAGELSQFSLGDVNTAVICPCAARW